MEQVSCSCGFVAREDNDVISVDMCDGDVFETTAEVKIRSPLKADGGSPTMGAWRAHCGRMAYTIAT